MTNEILDRIKYYAIHQPQMRACGYNGEDVTYLRFDRETDDLAKALKTVLGDKRQIPIIIYMKRGIKFVEMMIAVMKCQCFYIPAEENIPPDRIKYIYKDVGAGLIITDDVKLFEEEKSCDYENLMEIGRKLDFSLGKHLVKKDDLVYAMYTSGTTGTPKGVKIKYSNLLNLMYSFYDVVYKNFSEPISVGVVAAFSFDSSVKQIYGAFFYGHFLCIAQNSDKILSRKLHAFHIENDLKVCDLTPSHLRLMSMKKTEHMSSIPYLLLGGELLTWDVLHDYEKSVGKGITNFINVYGPTECCVDVAYKVITERDLRKYTTGSVPIGKAVRNTQLLLLDEDGNEVSDSYKEGELCVVGAQVGAGYVNVKSETFVEYNDKLIYKTGDLAYFDDNGDCVVIGRRDSQVKIHGYRVELGEIQSVLKKLTGCECAVFCEKDPLGNNKKLAAFICNNNVTESEIDKYRKEMSRVLPSYMVPNYFISGKGIPLTTNGKMDEKVLCDILAKKIEMSRQIS